MPIYEYRCDTCEVVFDAFSSIEDRELGNKCPICEGLGNYVVSAPHIGAWLDSDRWVKNRESHMKKERKNMKNHGTYD